MKKTEREMLVLAAKAIGRNLDLDRYDDEMGFIILGISRWWNPLNHDGDALQLAVKLRLTVMVWSDGECASAAKTAPDGLLALEQDAHSIFNDPPSCTAQEVRDVIEWYAASVRVALSAAPPPPERELVNGD